MLYRVSKRMTVCCVVVCCLAMASVGCTPPAPSDVGKPVSPGSTSPWGSPGVTTGPLLPPVEEPKMEEPGKETSQFPIQKTEEEWKALLTPEQFRITRLKGTELPGTGLYWKTKTAGTYECICCGQTLFVSDAKFDSGCGWPSFFQGIEGAITTQPDYSILPARTEIMCSKCGAHLGHVFEDGPLPTGQRFCVNSASVKLIESESEKGESEKPSE